MVITCSGLIEVAESIHALIAIRDKVELALKQKDTALWQTIAREPVMWANLGKKLQSSSIFKEAVKHVVEKWRTLTQQGETENLQEDIEQLCQLKYRDHEMTKATIDIRISGHYPDALSPGGLQLRTDYAADIHDWQAVYLFRHWLMQSAFDQKYRSDGDGGYSWYEMILKGGEAYLNHEDRRNST